jgi:acyl dehydratase
VADKFEVGAQLAGVEKRISFETMRRYSGEKGIHAEEDAGKEKGLGGALVQGGQLVAYLNQMMTNNFGEGYLRGGDIAVSFIKPVRPGGVITTKGIVQEIRPEGQGSGSCARSGWRTRMARRRQWGRPAS